MRSFEEDVSSADEGLQYLYFKLKYMRAKLLRKVRQHKQADDQCQELIDFVRTKMPTQATP